MASNIGWKPRHDLDERTGISLRFVTTLCLLAGVFITSVYKAALTSELAVRWRKWPINSLEELLSSDYKLLTVPGTVMQSHIEESPKGSTFNSIMMEDGKLVYKHGDEFAQYWFDNEKIALYGTDITGRLTPQQQCMVRAFLHFQLALPF